MLTILRVDVRARQCKGPVSSPQVIFPDAASKSTWKTSRNVRFGIGVKLHNVGGAKGSKEMVRFTIRRVRQKPRKIENDFI